MAETQCEAGLGLAAVPLLEAENILCGGMEDSIHSGLALGNSSSLQQGFEAPALVCRIFYPLFPYLPCVRLFWGAEGNT